MVSKIVRVPQRPKRAKGKTQAKQEFKKKNGLSHRKLVQRMLEDEQWEEAKDTYLK